MALPVWRINEKTFEATVITTRGSRPSGGGYISDPNSYIFPILFQELKMVHIFWWPYFSHSPLFSHFALLGTGGPNSFSKTSFTQNFLHDYHFYSF